MRIAILGTPLETATALTPERLGHDIVAFDRLIKKIKSGKADQSLSLGKDDLWWLQLYANALDYYKRGMVQEAEEMSYLAERYRPAVIEQIIARHKLKRNK